MHVIQEPSYEERALNFTESETKTLNDFCAILLKKSQSWERSSDAEFEVDHIQSAITNIWTNADSGWDAELTSAITFRLKNSPSLG